LVGVFITRVPLFIPADVTRDAPRGRSPRCSWASCEVGKKKGDPAGRTPAAGLGASGAWVLSFFFLIFSILQRPASLIVRSDESRCFFPGVASRQYCCCYWTQFPWHKTVILSPHWYIICGERGS
jgi:hypothetical protein